MNCPYCHGKNVTELNKPKQRKKSTVVLNPKKLALLQQCRSQGFIEIDDVKTYYFWNGKRGYSILEYLESYGLLTTDDQQHYTLTNKGNLVLENNLKGL